MKSWKKNRKAGAGFLLTVMMLRLGIVNPFFRIMSELVMRLLNYRYLTAENISAFARRPLVIAALLVGTFIYGLIEFFGISGVTYYLDVSRREEVALQDIIRFSAASIKELLKTKKRYLIYITLIFSPIFHLGSGINMLNYYSVFARVIKFVERRWINVLFVVLVIMGILLMFSRWMYMLHIFILEQEPQPSKRSRQLTARQPWYTCFLVIRQQIRASFAYMLISLALIGLIGLLQYVPFFSGAQISSVQVVILKVTQTLFDALTAPIAVTTITRLYRRVRGGYRYNDRALMITGNKRSTTWYKRQQILFFGSLFACALLLGRSSVSQFRLRIEHLRSVEVSAHRGASMYAPENTMSAFTLAVEQGADWIELDVQQSSDGAIFVMHDESFRRTTGLDARSWQLPFYKIRLLDAGSFFNKSYEGERIPLLRDVIDMAIESGIRLNIELKPNGHEKNLVDAVLDIVEEKQFESQCVITSQKYEILKAVKKRNPEIQTVYVMGLAYGAINRLKAADAFSIRSNSITQSLVTDLHNRGREVYAWTVDSRENMNRMINLGVDNIITNNVPLARSCINDSRTNSVLLQLIAILWENLPGTS